LHGCQIFQLLLLDGLLQWMRLIPTTTICTISRVPARTNVTAVLAIAEHTGCPAAAAVVSADDATAFFPTTPSAKPGGADTHTTAVFLAAIDATTLFSISTSAIPGTSY